MFVPAVFVQATSQAVSRPASETRLRALTMPRGRAQTLAKVLRGAAVLGLIASVVGVVAGLLLLTRAEAALDASLRLTDDTLEALDASAGVATDTVGTLGESLTTLQQTADALDGTFEDGEALVGGLADLVRDDVAPAVAAVEGGVADLVDIGRTIDGTLTQLSSLPFADALYDPDQSFAAGLTQVGASLEGLSSSLEEQAEAVDSTAAGLSAVGDGVAGLASDLAAFDTTLEETSALLATYDETIQEGRELVADTRDDLGSQLAFTRLAIVLFGVAFALSQLPALVLASLLTAPSPPTDVDPQAG